MLKVILQLKIKSFKAQLKYPVNFAIHVVGISLTGFAEILLVLILMNAFESIGGWNFWQVGFMVSLWRMSHSLHHALFLPFWGHIWLVRGGNYDRFLVRPVHPILQILASQLDLAAIGEWLPAITLFAITCSTVKVTWNITNIVFLIVVIFSGAIIEWATYLFFSAFDFWLGQAGVLWIPSAFLFPTARYPAHIYNRTFSFLITFVFPYAFMAYYPTHHFFQLDTQVLWGIAPYITPIIAVISLTIAVTAWSLGLKHYQSTGT